MKFFPYVLLILPLFSCDHTKEQNLSPLEKLKAGNERFTSGKLIHPDETLERLRELKKGQNPFSVIVSCSDSRLPPELIFDQGLGDIFSIRTAGNIIGDYELGSVEYAVDHLNCKLVVVLGHQECGAIKTFVETKGRYSNMDHIKSIIDFLNEETEEQELLQHSDIDINKAVEANVIHGIKLLRNSQPILNKLYTAKEVQIIGAIYDLDNGFVKYINF